MEFKGYARAFYDIDGEMRRVRILDVQNFMEHIVVVYAIYHMDDPYILNQQHISIPYEVYIEYLNGIPDYI